MHGEKNIDRLIRDMHPKLAPEVYVFATLQPRDIPPDLKPKMAFQESEGTTLILTLSDARQWNICFEFPCRMITLAIHSSLEASGFIARIATALAELDMGVNPVAGFYHDHLFVPLGREDDAMAARDALSKRSKNQRL